MKAVLAAFTFSLAAQAHAAVVDVFDCTLTITNKTNEIRSSHIDRLAMIREPEAKVDGWETTNSEAKLTLESRNGRARYLGTLDFVMRIAVKMENGKAVEARQSTHFFPETGYCNKPSCMSGGGAGQPIPGDPVKYGKPAALKDGIMVIDPDKVYDEKLGFSDPDDTVARGTCKLVETLK